ncbi:hypothetical protein T265_00910 [Opisthorchis viverrini]|uniref:Uncharacterized protein n=1 Tax=Opisthorchis viverrini TaxID=6198 RepID=A0A075A0L1_OPIVI|nr:hypothetical protein T265_00910 [Opisthorchis viverrini]KER33223.1 hypothetical protein T265_00910 [Opisthorchis viverrini]
MKERSQAAIAGLQQVVRDSQDQVVRLETRLRQLSAVNEVTTESENETVGFVKRLYQRMGLSDLTTSYDRLYNKISDRLDQLALLELQHAQTEAKLTKVMHELESLQTSATDLTNRYELILLEKKTLTEEVASLKAKNADLLSQVGLHQTSLESKEKQIQEMRKQLEESNLVLQRGKQEWDSLKFTSEMTAIQMKSLLESLAASLSTVEQPCTPTETGVKEAVRQLLEQVKLMRENGAVFHGKVTDLQKQFEAQFKAGQVVNEELKLARQHVREAESDKCHLETEVLGLKLMMRNAEEERSTNNELCKRLADILNKGELGTTAETLKATIGTLEQLVARGCISQSCLTPTQKTSVCEHRKDYNEGHFHHPPICPPVPESVDRTMMPTCDHRSLDTLLEKLRGSKGQLTEFELHQIRELCTKCLQNLAICAWKLVKENQRNSAFRNNESGEALIKGLELQLETERERVKTLSVALSVAEDKIAKADALDEAVVKLEKSRKLQAKQLEKFHRQVERGSLDAKHHAEALQAAKRLLAETHDRKFKLSRFFDLIGRMVNVDTRFEPNPEMQIIQRIQQLLEVMRRAGIHQQPMIIPLSTSPSLYTTPGVGGFPSGEYGMWNPACPSAGDTSNATVTCPDGKKALCGTSLRRLNDRSVSFEQVHSRELTSAPAHRRAGSQMTKNSAPSKITGQDQSLVPNKRPPKRDEKKY